MSEAIDHVQQEEHNCSSITNYTQNLQIMVEVIKKKQFFFITKKIYISSRNSATKPNKID